MADPAHLDTAYRGDTGFFRECGFGGVHKAGVYAIHQPAEYVDSGGAQNCKDGQGDQQPDDGIGKWESESESSGAGHDCE